MSKYLIGFIGCGNMGGALVRAAAKCVCGNNIAVCDYDEKKAQALATECGASVSSGKEIARNCRFIVLGVKPQNMQETIAGFAGELQENDSAVVITMAAGLSISAIRSFIGFDLPVIRIMPNTPAQVGEGMILYDTQSVSQADEQAFLDCFKKAGVLDKLPEDKIDAASALSGCGPAFAYAFAKALTDGAVECGVPADKAATYTAQTLLGAAKMLLAYGDPTHLINAVCSPNGTTLAGMRALEENGFEDVAMSAVKAAYKRTLELKK